MRRQGEAACGCAPRIKMCGLFRMEDILAANRLLPDYVGFVFAPESRRYVEPRQAARLRELLNPAIKTVGVFVQAEEREAARLAKDGVIDLIQLHGNEKEDYIRRLRMMTDCPLIKAFSIDRPGVFGEMEACTADFLLLDSGPGGTGRRLDWRQLAKEGYDSLKKPWFLAGGLTPENVEEAIALLRPWGLDVSSGIETEGKKDENKMAAFAAAVRKEG